MTLEEAIEIKLQWRKANYPPPLALEMSADMLSIQALKRHKEMSALVPSMPYPLLPGETKV